MTSELQIVSSLRDVVSPEADAMLKEAQDKHLLGDFVLGLLREGEAYCMASGSEVSVDSRFEIGSITKTYTAELLSILANRGVVQMDDPVQNYLPSATKKITSGRPITLLDLATHHSGLPSLPTNLIPVYADPYAEYTIDELDAYLSKRKLQCSNATGFKYSNLGYSVLGHALGRAAGTTYAELLMQEILEPLGLKQTSLALARHELPEIVVGHSQTGRSVPRWTSDVCAPAGALCSTVGDQLMWIESMLADPDRASLTPHAMAGGGQVGLGWMIRPGGESCWHNGGTGGFSSYIGLHKKQRSGVVILSNWQAYSLVTVLGGNFQRILSGMPAIPLSGNYGQTKARFVEPFQRIFGSRPVVAFARMPAWARFPLATAGAYGINRLVEYLTHR